MIPLVSEVLCGMDLESLNQALVCLLYFSTGAEEEPDKDVSLLPFGWTAAPYYSNIGNVIIACLK